MYGAGVHLLDFNKAKKKQHNCLNFSNIAIFSIFIDMHYAFM